MLFCSFEPTELESLYAPHGRQMLVASCLDEPESWSQRLSKRCCVVSHNWKAAAPLRTVESKGADDGVPTDAKRSRKSENVGRRRSVVNSGETDWAVLRQVNMAAAPAS